MPQSRPQCTIVIFTSIILILGCAPDRDSAAQPVTIQSRTLRGRTFTLTGMDALLYAIMINDSNTAKKLLDEGMDINKPFQRGWTFLHLAAQKNRVEIAEMLISKGARVNVRNGKDGQGSTPLEVAVSRKHNEMAEMLRKHGAH